MQFALLMVLFLLTCSGRALAQEKGDGERRSDAELALDYGHRALAHFEALEFAEAVQDFERAEALAHSPVFLFYLGRAERARGRLIAARRFFLRCAAEALRANSPATWRRSVEEAKVALFSLDQEIPRLTIEVDDRATAPISIEVGGETLRLERPGQAEFRRDPGKYSVTVEDALGRRRRWEWHARTFSTSFRRLSFSQETGRVSHEHPSEGTKGQRAMSPPRLSQGLQPAELTAFSLAGVSAGVATAAFVSAMGRASAIKSRCPDGVCRRDETTQVGHAERDLRISVAALVVGGVGLATGLSLLALRWKNGRVESKLRLTPTGVAWGVGF